MPNHVTTILTAPPYVLHALMTEAGVDFNRVIPMPPDVLRGNITSEERAANPLNWYDWSITHWGTKWNGYDHQIDESASTLRFDTAWASPTPVIEALSRQFPLVPIRVQYADEDISHNQGDYTILNGMVCLDASLKDGTPEAEAFALAVKGWSADA